MLQTAPTNAHISQICVLCARCFISFRTSATSSPLNTLKLDTPQTIGNTGYSMRRRSRHSILPWNIDKQKYSLKLLMSISHAKFPWRRSLRIAITLRVARVVETLIVQSALSMMVHRALTCHKLFPISSDATICIASLHVTQKYPTSIDAANDPYDFRPYRANFAVADNLFANTFA